MSDALLAMKHVTKRFPGVIALDNVSFDLHRGEVHALLGENGAGKSTLMKILSGVYTCDEGEIILDGKKVTIDTPIQAGLLGIAIIHQEFNLFPDLTVEENIFIGREFYKHHRWILDEPAQRQAVLDILAMLNLNIDPTRRITQLTVAQQQMVEIAKALSVNAKILIMDEPTAALTESEIASLFNVIELLKSQGVAIVYISHRLEELALIADRATVMRDGKYIGTVDYTTVRIERLIAMMVGRELGDIYPARAVTPGNEVVLAVDNLGRKGVLQNVSFVLRRGEILGIAGLMGAGRTEVARALFGADPVDSGEIRLFGRSVKIDSVHSAIAHGIGYLTEDRKRDGLALGLSVGVNIMLSSYSRYANAWGIINEQRCNGVSEKLRQQLHIKTPGLEQLAVNLSGGNQQKIIIAKWLCRNSEILIFDEPTRGIDVGAKLEIYDLINRLTQEGKSIIMISSELPEILGMCDRILVMRQGQITAELPAAQADQESIMKFATLEG